MPFRADILQWRAAGITYREIHERICEKGYSGTQDAIRGFISKERRIQRDLKNAVGGDPIELIDKKWLIRLLYKPIDDVKGITPEQLNAIFDNYPLAKDILDVVHDFKKLVKAKKQEDLLPWMKKVVALDIPELVTFVNGLNQDLTAVINAIASNYSNGLVEGTVNKIKVIKRIMYGRCQFELLRSKCLMLDYFV